MWGEVSLDDHIMLLHNVDGSAEPSEPPSAADNNAGDATDATRSSTQQQTKDLLIVIEPFHYRQTFFWFNLSIET